MVRLGAGQSEWRTYGIATVRNSALESIDAGIGGICEIRKSKF